MLHSTVEVGQNHSIVVPKGVLVFGKQNTLSNSKCLCGVDEVTPLLNKVAKLVHNTKLTNLVFFIHNCKFRVFVIEKLPYLYTISYFFTNCAYFILILSISNIDV